MHPNGSLHNREMDIRVSTSYYWKIFSYNKWCDGSYYSQNSSTTLKCGHASVQVVFGVLEAIKLFCRIVNSVWRWALPIWAARYPLGRGATHIVTELRKIYLAPSFVSNRLDQLAMNFLSRCCKSSYIVNIDGFKARAGDRISNSWARLCFRYSSDDERRIHWTKFWFFDLEGPHMLFACRLMKFLQKVYVKYQNLHR